MLTPRLPESCVVLEAASVAAAEWAAAAVANPDRVTTTTLPAVTLTMATASVTMRKREARAARKLSRSNVAIAWSITVKVANTTVAAAVAGGMTGGMAEIGADVAPGGPAAGGGCAGVILSKDPGDRGVGGSGRVVGGSGRVVGGGDKGVDGGG